MAIPVRERSNTVGAGTVAFLCVRPGDGQLRGALFVVNDRAEPLDYCFNSVEVPSSFLWRTGEAHRHALRILTVSLFAACPGSPDLLLAHRHQVGPKLFTEDLAVDIAVALVAESDDGADVSWIGQPPAEGSMARNLLDALVSYGLALEPFERAANALDEALPNR